MRVGRGETLSLNRFPRAGECMVMQEPIQREKKEIQCGRGVQLGLSSIRSSLLVSLSLSQRKKISPEEERPS